MRYVVIALVALMSAGCHQQFGPGLAAETAHVIAHNTDNVQIFVYGDDGQGHPVEAGNNTKWDQTIPVPETPRQPGYYGPLPGPSNIDKTTTVYFSVRVPSKGIQTLSYGCSAGTKIITDLDYVPLSSGGGYLTCKNTTIYGELGDRKLPAEDHGPKGP